MTDKINKIWATVAQFDTYEEADLHRFELILKEQHQLVKVRRGTDKYRVKAWDPPPPKENKKKKKKNANKKVRN